MTSGSSHLDEIQDQKTRNICGKPSNTALVAATQRAHALERRTASAHLHPVAVPEIDHDPAKGGDEESQ